MIIHEDKTDTGKTVWWADTADIERLTIGGDSLEELEALAREAVEFHLGPNFEVRFEAEGTHSAV